MTYGQAREFFSAGRLVGRVLRDQLAAESLGEQRWRELPDALARARVARLETVDEGEQRFDAADDFVLFVGAREWQQKRFDCAEKNVRLRGCG